MTVWAINCRWPQDVAAAGLDGGEGHWTGGTETGVDPTRVVTHTTQSHLAGAFATLQAMWTVPVVAASRQKTDWMRRVWSMTGEKMSQSSLLLAWKYSFLFAWWYINRHISQYNFASFGFEWYNKMSFKFDYTTTNLKLTDIKIMISTNWYQLTIWASLLTEIIMSVALF